MMAKITGQQNEDNRCPTILLATRCLTLIRHIVASWIRHFIMIVWFYALLYFSHIARNLSRGAGGLMQ